LTDLFRETGKAPALRLVTVVIYEGKLGMIFKTTSLAAVVIAVSGLGNASARQTPSADTLLSQLVLPPGFHISVYAGNVRNARQTSL
jgi:hypothetical protein